MSLITAGSLSSQKVLYIGLAKDADRAVRIDANFVDCGSIAKVLAETIKRLGCASSAVMAQTSNEHFN